MVCACETADAPVYMPQNNASCSVLCRYKGGGTPSGQSMGSTDHLVAPRRSPMGRKPPPVEAYSSSMPGMGMGSTDHLVAPRRSPMGRRPPASMSVRSADTGMAAASEPLNLAPPSAAPRNVPVPASERRDKSRSSSVAGSAPRYGSAAAPRSAMRDARPQRAQHAQQEEQEITTAPAASAARRIPGVQEEPQVRRGGGRRGSNQEGSHGKHKSGSVPLGAFLTALNKEEAKVIIRPPTPTCTLLNARGPPTWSCKCGLLFN